MSEFRTVVIDPPWWEVGGGGRGAQNHYPLMRTPDIVYTIFDCGEYKRVASRAHLWLWVTDNHLADGMAVLEALGWSYKRTFVWVKYKKRLQMGLGQYARGCKELCLFATRGRSMVPARAPKDTFLEASDTLFAPRQAHSKKPERFYTEVVERVSPGPYLEMFARRPRANWTAWGNELDVEETS